MKNRTTLILLCLLFSFGNALAQPANDNCSGATNIGILPTPGACVSGLQNGAVLTFSNQTTVGATSPNPYVYQTACQGGGNMTTFALDTWYFFTATGTTVNVSITGFPNAQIALYSGTCGNLQGLGCSTTGTMFVTQIFVGQTYYLQISGNTTTSTDNSFSIAIDNDIDCNDCLLGSSITATPAPVNGGYSPGQVVHFCYNVTNFSEVNTNWFHGVQISMGPGWTGVVSNPTPAVDCNVDVTPGLGNAGAGAWAWYPAGITSSANGTVWPAGFYFDNSNVAGTNAGNNFGDPGNCGWSFCWDLTVSTGCSNGANLNVNVNSSGDGESGSWSSLGCVDDPPTIFSAIELCCSATAANTGPYCLGQTIQLNGTGGGTYSWTGPNGFVSLLQNPTLPSSAASAGNYTLSINNGGCITTATTTVALSALPTVNAGNDVSVCQNQTTTLTATGANTYTWSPVITNGVAFVPAATTTYTVTGTTAAGCVNTDQVIVTVNPLPTVNAGTDQQVCTGGQATLTAVGANTYSWSPTITNGIPFTPPIGTTVYTVSGTSAAGCVSTDAVQVVSSSSPPVSAGTYTPVCINAGSVALSGTPAGGTFTGTGVTGVSFNPASGTQTVTYNYTDANGCSGSGTATITVNPLPVVDAGTYNPICADAANLPLVGTPAGGTFSGTGVTANAFDPSVNTQTVTYTYTNANGCVNTDVATITVIQPVPPNAGIYTSVCIDASNVLLNGTPAGGTFTGTGVTAGSFDPSAGTQTVTYTYSDATGCISSATATIAVNPLPIVGAGTAQVICEGSAVTLNGSGAATYTWSGGVLNGQSFTPALGQNVYTVSGTDVNGCISTASVNVNVLTSPIALVTSDVQTGNPVLDVNFANGSQFSTAYTWDFGNGNSYTSNLTDSTTQSYADPGTYIVTLIASNGLCLSIDSLVIVVVPFNGPEVEVPNVISPNADDANDIFFLTHLYTEKIYIVILNRWGEVVFETTDENPQWDGSAQNGRPVKDGVYFYKYIATGINGTELKGHGNITVVR